MEPALWCVWSGREDCFQGNNCAAVAASATGGGADLCGFLSPAARITGFRGAPCNPTFLGPGFHGCREEWGSSKGCSVPVESLTSFPVLHLNRSLAFAWAALLTFLSPSSAVRRIHVGRSNWQI